MGDDRNAKAEAIAKVLRRAAGLPAATDPLVSEAGKPDLRFVVFAIMGAVGAGDAWARTPAKVSKDIDDIRKKWRNLRALINSMDGGTRAAINNADAEAFARTPELIGDGAVEDAIEAMNRLELAMRSAAIQATAIAATTPKATKKGGRPVDHDKGAVALLVARYLKNANGRIWIGDPPPGWEIDESGEPFAVALREIFKILGLGTKIKSAVSNATLKLQK